MTRVEHCQSAAQCRLDDVDDTYQSVRDSQRDEAGVRRLLQVVHRVAQALARQHDQVESVSQYAEQRHEGRQNFEKQ